MVRSGLPTLLAAGLLACLTGPASRAQAPTTPPAAAGTSPSLQQFANRNRTFHVDVPLGWRQVAPNEALRIGAHADAPLDLRRAEPRAQYAVGPVERWLAGDFASPWLYVTEIGEEAVVPDDFERQLTAMWEEHGKALGIVHSLALVRRENIGPGSHPVITAHRTSTPTTGRPTRSLDVYVATGRQQITLALTCWAEDFARHEPQFRQWLQTATFARPPRAEQKLSDRLWTPLLTGAVVSVILFALYKHSRRPR